MPPADRRSLRARPRSKPPIVTCPATPGGCERQWRERTFSLSGKKQRYPVVHWQYPVDSVHCRTCRTSCGNGAGRPASLGGDRGLEKPTEVAFIGPSLSHMTAFPRKMTRGATPLVRE